MELYTRSVSAIPVSIGTSLALESIFMGTQAPFDVSRQIPQQINLLEYQECWFNIETLIRNIAHSVERERFMDCTPDHIADILLSEMEIIESVFQSEGRGTCRPVFYFCSYVSLRSEYKGRVNFRESTTIIQKTYDYKVDQVLKRIKQQTNKLVMLDSSLKPESRLQAMVLTHIPYDLTSYERFRKLDLLESHTGVLKTYRHWNTKYATFGQESLRHLPFHKSLLLIFGDKHQIEPQKRSFRNLILDVSKKDRWTPLTTTERMKMAYRTHVTHPADLQFLLSF